MNRLQCTLIATACLAFAAACEKHQEPIGTVPADDVPAMPATGSGTQGPASGAGEGTASGAGQDAAGGMRGGNSQPPTGAGDDTAACEAMIGAEREACLRQHPPTTATPVEPQRNQPPQSLD